MISSVQHFKWTKYCGLSPVGIDNANANPKNIIFTIKDRKLYDSVIMLLAKDNEILSKILSKWFEISVYWNEDKIST